MSLSTLSGCTFRAASSHPAVLLVYLSVLTAALRYLCSGAGGSHRRPGSQPQPRAQRPGHQEGAGRAPRTGPLEREGLRKAVQNTCK